MASNQKEINGRTYSFGVIPAMEALKVEIAVAKQIGEPLFRAFMDNKKTGMSAEEQTAAGSMAMGALLSGIDETALVSIVTTVMKYVSCDGARVNVDSTFTGRNKDLWLVLIEALRFNFSDFLPENLFASVPVVQ